MCVKGDRNLHVKHNQHVEKEKRKKRKLVHFIIYTPIIMCWESESAVRSGIRRLYLEIGYLVPADPHYRCTDTPVLKTKLIFVLRTADIPWEGQWNRKCDFWFRRVRVQRGRCAPKWQFAASLIFRGAPYEGSRE